MILFNKVVSGILHALSKCYMFELDVDELVRVEFGFVLTNSNFESV